MILHLNLHSSEYFPFKLYHNTVSTENVNIKVSNGKSLVTIKTCCEESYSVEEQSRYGQVFHSNQYTTYEINFDKFSDLVPQIEVFHGTTCIGQSFITSTQFSTCCGSVKSVLINPSSNQLSAEITFDYLIISPWQKHPLRSVDAVLSSSYFNSEFVLMGHRGSGKTLDSNAIMFENTIQSFSSAYSVGASFVELDVQLTKDLVPVIFHDFYASIYSQKRNGEHDLLHVAVKDLTMEEVKCLKMNFAREIAGTNYDSRHDSLFPSLYEVLHQLPEDLGLFIEVKYPYQLLETKEWEVENFNISRNVVVDQTLDVVMSYQGKRPIAFCTFDPEICLMLHYKQEQFPVVFITCGENEHYDAYMDIRNRTRKIAAQFSLLHGLLGISIYSDPLVYKREEYSDLISIMKKNNKHLFSWGVANCNNEFVLHQKSIGVTGIISDCVDKLDVSGLMDVSGLKTE